MIAYIKGNLAYTTPDTAVVECGGVGYEIYIPLSVHDRLPGTGSPVTLYTYLHVREEIMQLYGFLDRDSLELFKMLITVSGIGPKGALGILSAMTPDTLRFAILADDAKTIAKAPGIGPKTAKKLVLELKDKMNLQTELERLGASSSSVVPELPTSSDGADSASVSVIRRETIEALTALGYSGTEAMSAVRSIDIADGMTTEDVLKLALKAL